MFSRRSSVEVVTGLSEQELDWALEGVTDPLKIADIPSELDDLTKPYRFDVVAVSTVQSASLLEHLSRVGVRIYECGRVQPA